MLLNTGASQWATVDNPLAVTGGGRRPPDFPGLAILLMSGLFGWTYRKLTKTFLNNICYSF
jgi:hypothetical protein